MKKPGIHIWKMTTQMALIYSTLVLALGLILLSVMSKVTKELSVRRLGGELEGIVATAAMQVDGERHRLFLDEQATRDPEWLKMRDFLERVRATNGLERDHIYTFHFSDRTDPSKLNFAVMLHEKPFVGDPYRVPTQIQELINKALQTGEPQSSGIYEDEHGRWISALTIIRDSRGRPGGIFQADHGVETDNRTFRMAVSDDFNQVRLAFIVLAPAVFILIYLITRSIARPIEEMAQVAEVTNDGNWHQPMPKMRWNELRRLSDSFDSMRRKIGKQIDVLRDFNRELEHQVSLKTRDLQETNECLKRAQTDLEKQALAQIEYEKTHDVLTGLANRTLLNKDLTLAAATAQLKGTMAAVLVIGIDRFRKVNQSVGTEQGDRILQELSRKLASSVKENDTVARIDGDRFAVVLPDIDREESAVKVANRLLALIGEPLPAGNLKIHLDASVGISVFPQDTEDVSVLLKNAETAMFNAKLSGGGRYRCYTQSMDESSERRLTLENGIREALQGGEFQLYYQPQVALEDNRVIGVEALIRWRKPDGGLISPGEFIPLAEETGLIVPLGKWVIETACRDTRRWQEMGLPPLVTAVNLSARQFEQKDLVDYMGTVLEKTGLNPGNLELEITESVVMDDVRTTIKILAQLKEMGLQLAIDDFGTGYSSLSYLKQFAVDKLKIDRSFVINAHEDAEDEAIARAVINLGHSLGLKVIAEGVETDEQLEFLRRHGCDEVQGYYFGKPMPEGELVTLLAKGDRLQKVG
ncbi:MAG: EAL domain-containing protein [Acidobacteriota bacterium]|nr:EAL domain-containing protein [Acidobacteriota bacterium]